MTDEERRAMMRSNWDMQMEGLGYEPDGTPKDMVEVVRCRNCRDYLEPTCPCLELNKGGSWYCGDGKRK